MATPLIVNVVELLRWPGTVKDVRVSIAAEDFDFRDSRLVDLPVEVAIHLESLSNGIVVSGSAEATWAGECRRCLRPIRDRLEVDFDELYQQVPDNPDAYAIVNDQIDLLPMVRENVLLAIPLGALCRPDCPGLCPHCGQDLSEGQCGCAVGATDPRWAALDDLRKVLDDGTE